MRAKTTPQGCAPGSNLLQAKLRYDPLGRLYEVEKLTCGVA